MVTVRQLAEELSSLKKELQDKEVKVLAKNDLLLPAEIRFEKKDKYSLDITKENVEFVVITW